MDRFTSLASREFDYIICGGGTSGSLLASRLSKIPNITILLIEAGRDSSIASDVLVPGKYISQLSEDHDGLWEMPTVPQEQLNGRSLTFLRGKQIGGSSAVNYMALARGPAADYDEWAKLTGDEGWKWDNVLPLMKGLENFDPRVPEGYEKFAVPDPGSHGAGGPLAISFGEQMVPGVETFIDACKEKGIQLCLDNNAGDPVGVGLAHFNVGNGQRSYAANAFLGAEVRRKAKGLTVLTRTVCDKILFEGKKATGVELFHVPTGEKVRVDCRQEIILAAGAFGSPQLLMLSGVGPRHHLESHGIPVVADVLGVGQNALDHSVVTIEYKVRSDLPDHNRLFINPLLLAEAEARYSKDRTGPLAVFGTSGTVAFPKIKQLYESREFHALDTPTQAYLLEKTRPSAEIWLAAGPSFYANKAHPNESFVTHELLLQNNLSKGTVSLRSSNPRDLPVIDPKFLDHPFDRRIAIETVKEAVRIAQATAYDTVIEKMVHGPGKQSKVANIDVDDEVVLNFVRENLGQGYHTMATCRMGTKHDPLAVVDSEFHVVGVEGLRLADLSVCPVLTCNHTQINAYLIGEKCAKILLGMHSFRLETVESKL
ncbi:glucose-methanol-choline oxidoreductase [Lophium mytilinum]|uniref:Glucose-methanol-choline oxidoreductase n=1 Tax=Lophium mytilinum TaxID=390894 RepID=A0A6A6QWK7_9PEZI|nr:glucose-methanol-choline oxidoreductase [Lophium mytilinum]